MKISTIFTICLFLLGACCSWLIANWATTFSSQPEYLEYFPAWADRMVYFASNRLLDDDMSIAAVQMNFIEIFGSAFITLSILNGVLITLLNKYLFKGEDTDNLNIVKDTNTVKTSA